MIGDSKDITEAPDACYIDQQKFHICRRARGKPGSDYEEFVTDQQLQSFMKVRISEFWNRPWRERGTGYDIQEERYLKS